MFRQLADGTLPASEFSIVEQRLLTDAGFRERYVLAIDRECGLYQSCDIPGGRAVPVVRSGPTIKLISMIAAGVTVFYGVAAWLFWMSSTLHPNAKDVARLQSKQAPVATVMRADYLEESLVTSFEPGMLAIPGVLKIGCGQVQLEFLNGAQLNVEGPVELHLLSVDSAKLISGKAAVRVPSEARGFVLNTSNTSIASLGAEFAIAVDKQRESEIRVVSGEITVSLHDKKGNVSSTLSVTKTNSLRVNRNPAGLELIDAPTVDLPNIQTQIPALPLIRTRHCNILPFSSGTAVLDGK